MPKKDSASNGKNAADLWKIDLTSWQTMEPIMKWNSAANAGRIAEMVEVASSVVEAWPHDSDPADPDSYALLTPPQFKEMSGQIGDRVTTLFQG